MIDALTVSAVERDPRMGMLSDIFEACARPILTALTPLASTAGAEVHILDLGCGDGELTIPAALMMPEATFYALGTDAQTTRDVRHRAQACKAENIHPLTFDGRKLPDICATLDGVFSYGFLPRMSSAATWDLLRVVARSLVPGGIARLHVAPNAPLPLEQFGMKVMAVDVTPLGVFVTARRPA